MGSSRSGVQKQCPPGASPPFPAPWGQCHEHDPVGSYCVSGAVLIKALRLEGPNIVSLGMVKLGSPMFKA